MQDLFSPSPEGLHSERGPRTTVLWFAARRSTVWWWRGGPCVVLEITVHWFETLGTLHLMVKVKERDSTAMQTEVIRSRSDMVSSVYLCENTEDSSW